MGLLNFDDPSHKIAAQDMELTDTVKELLIKLLPEGHTKKSEDLAYVISWHLQSDYGIYSTVTSVKLRKWVSFFRSEGLLPIMASSEGYSITYDKRLIEEQALSLEQRASQIRRAAEGLRKNFL